MTAPIANARLRPMIWPIFPPVIMNAAITNVYIVIAVWMPVTVVPTSLATVAIDTFITDVSSVMRNCAEASVRSTTDAAPATTSALDAASSVDISGEYAGAQSTRELERSSCVRGPLSLSEPRLGHRGSKTALRADAAVFLGL